MLAFLIIIGPITIKEIKFIDKYLSERKAPNSDRFTCKFYQTVKE
jgi:hypothetical protein